MRIEEPSAHQFDIITRLIGRFELDDRELLPASFLIALAEAHSLLGFGRIREYEGCSELCSLGVIEPQRHKGIGSRLVQELIGKAQQPLYLVCIIPEFFGPLGFKIVEDYPPELQLKLDYCRASLSVPEEYVVMRHEKYLP